MYQNLDADLEYCAREIICACILPIHHSGLDDYEARQVSLKFAQEIVQIIERIRQSEVTVGSKIDAIIKYVDYNPPCPPIGTKALGARFDQGQIITFSDAQMSYIVDCSIYSDIDGQIVYWCHNMNYPDNPPDGYITDESAYLSRYNKGE